MSWPPGGRRGSQEPRLRSAPAYTATLGLEAVDLAAAAGLILDPWQSLCTCDILAVQDDGRWAALETCTITQRQNGKGAIIEAIELAGLFLFGEQLILHSAHEYKTAQEAFLRIKGLIDGCSDLSRYVKAIREANGEQQIILMSGARLRFVARSKGSGRGFSGQRNILDEAYALTRTQLAALLPTMSAQPNPQFNQFSTVPDPDTMPGPEEAVLPAVHKRALAAAESGASGGLVYHDWSMQPNEDAANVDLWYACNPALGIRISEDYVRAELAALGPDKFSVERLGLWPADVNSRWAVISEGDWLDVLDDASQAVDPLVFAIDVTPERSHGSIAAAGARADGDLHGEVVDHAQGTSWLVSRAAELDARWKPAAWVVDAGGAAGFVIPSLESAGLNVVKMTSRNVGQAYGMFRSATSSAEQGHAPPSAEQLTGEPAGSLDEPVVVPKIKIRPGRHGAALTSAVEGAATRRVGDGTTWDRKATAVVISPLVAVTNAVFGFVTREVVEADQPFFAAWRSH